MLVVYRDRVQAAFLLLCSQFLYYCDCGCGYWMSYCVPETKVTGRHNYCYCQICNRTFCQIVVVIWELQYNTKRLLIELFTCSRFCGDVLRKRICWIYIYSIVKLKRKQLCYCLCAHGKNFGRLLSQENIFLEYSKLSDSKIEEP